MWIEYEIPIAPVVARASFSSTTSPYVLTFPVLLYKLLHWAVVFNLAPNIRLDGVFRWNSLSELRLITAIVQNLFHSYTLK
jgi:Zn-dependent protease